jgi:Fic family protein
LVEKPPYLVTDLIVNRIADIVESLAKLRADSSYAANMRLRKDNQIRSICSSLAIENNTLSLEQVTDVIEGKRVLGLPNEIREVKNAFQAYSQIATFEPYSVDHFLTAHNLMMSGSVSRAGKFRVSGVGVFNGEKLIHAAPKAELVPGHMKNLFEWAKTSGAHPLIKSSVMHYEIEFIHPFEDGNGRIGRLWQSVVLEKWNALFAGMPIETVVHERQSEYYSALASADNSGESTVFIEFMVAAIDDAIRIQIEHRVKHGAEHRVKHNEASRQDDILLALRSCALPRKDLFAAVGLAGDTRSYQRHIVPLIEAGLISMTLPEKPSSRLQKYTLTRKGEQYAKKIARR